MLSAVSQTLLVLFRRDPMHSTTRKNLFKKHKIQQNVKDSPGFYFFVGLDNLKEMQSLKSDINFKFSWLSSDALPAKVKATYNNVKRLQDNDLYLRRSFR